MSAPGIDGIRAAELYAYLVGHWQELQHSVMDGTYRPEAVRRVEIPKP
ncbi:MAG TPA: group II intron reverse transcriptase/maturase, partial [Bacteroidetes bacterium]|nr:group II intron reverse transcriptase/maturase [Bacteroidota bacterium]